MKQVMLRLLDAQKTLLQKPNTTPEYREQVVQLRANVPAPVLAHFLRLVAQGHHGVAVVNHGVCSECHIRLPSSLAAALVKEDDLHVCEQCGAFLVPAPEQVAQPAPVAPKRPRARKYARQLAA